MDVNKWRKFLGEKKFADYDPPENQWIDIPVGDLSHDTENVDLTDEFFKLIDTAYSKIGGHFDFKKASDVPADHDVWSAVDIDGDAVPDAVRFGKRKPKGVKLTGSGHDGSRAAKQAYLQKTADLLHRAGYFAEMSKAIARIMITRYDIPYVDNPEAVQQALGPSKPIEWLGAHPEGKYPEHNGWYRRTIEGREGELKIMLGNPNVSGALEEDVDPEEVDTSSLEIQDSLHKRFWTEADEKLNPEISQNLLAIVEDYVAGLDVESLEIKDIVFTGSLATFNWSTFSDVDLHIIVDFEQVGDDVSLVSEFFRSSRALWNNKHTIMIYGFEVELYFQDDDEPHLASGLYSVTNDEWIKKPVREEPEVDWNGVKVKSAGLMDEIDRIQSKFEEGEHEEAILGAERIKAKIRRMRKSGLEKAGLYSVENLAFKVLRRNGYLKILSDIKIDAYDKKMSLSH